MKEDNDFLYSQLVKLGDMIGDGLHYEPDGKWISREYNSICRKLGMLPKKKRNLEPINKAMIDALKGKKCSKCDGELKQTKSGSMRAKCLECNAKFQILRRATK